MSPRAHQVTLVLALVVAALSMAVAALALWRQSAAAPFDFDAASSELPFPMSDGGVTTINGAVAQAIGTGYLTIEGKSEPSAEGVVTVQALLLGQRCQVQVVVPTGEIPGMPFSPMTAVCGQ